MPSSWVSLPPGPGRNWRGTILCLHPSLPPTSLRAEPGPPWWYPRPRSSVPAGAAPRWTGTNFCSTLPTSPERLVTRCPPPLLAAGTQLSRIASEFLVRGPSSTVAPAGVSRRRAVKVEWSWLNRLFLLLLLLLLSGEDLLSGQDLLSGRPSVLRSSALRSSACQRRLKAARAAAGCAQQDGDRGGRGTSAASK